MTDHVDEFRVPDGAQVAECDRCGRPFPTEQLLALHHGRAYPDDLSADERAAAAAAREAESTDVRVFRLQALAALVVCYFGFLFAYSIVG